MLHFPNDLVSSSAMIARFKDTSLKTNVAVYKLTVVCAIESAVMMCGDGVSFGERIILGL